MTLSFEQSRPAVESQAEKEKTTEVWVIDDFTAIFKALDKAVFSNYPNLEVRHFADGESALAAIDSASPEVILVDGDLGEKHLTGPEIIEELKKKGVSAKILGFSNSMTSNEAMVASGADGFVEKSVTGAKENLKKFIEENLI